MRNLTSDVSKRVSVVWTDFFCISAWVCMWVGGWVVVRDSTVSITDLDMLYLVKISNGGLVLGSSQVSLQSQLPQKMTLALKVVKIDSIIMISLRKSKSVKHSV